MYIYQAAINPIDSCAVSMQGECDDHVEADTSYHHRARHLASSTGACLYDSLIYIVLVILSIYT